MFSSRSPPPVATLMSTGWKFSVLVSRPGLARPTRVSSRHSRPTPPPRFHSVPQFKSAILSPHFALQHLILSHFYHPNWKQPLHLSSRKHKEALDNGHTRGGVGGYFWWFSPITRYSIPFLNKFPNKWTI